MDRPKHGFGAPVSRWFRDSLREDFLSTLNNRDITEWLPELDAAQIIKYAQNLTASSADTLSGNSFFVIYSYLKWCKMYVR